MKILFLRFPLESQLGGAERQTISLMEGLLERGHATAFVGSCPTLLELCAERDIINGELLIGPPPVTAWHALSFAWRRRGMQRALRDAIGQFSNLGAVVMLSLTEKLLLTQELHDAGVRVLWLEHDRVGRWLQRNPWLGTLRRLSNMATTVTVSDASREPYVQLGFPPDRIVSIPNGIDARRFAGVHAPVATDHLRVGCVARLSQDKGVDVLLDALALTEGATLQIVGKGKERAALLAQAERLEIAQRVTFHDSTDMSEFYASIDALVLPSRLHDPFGMVAAEAMLVGLPAIVTDACGIADSLTDGEDAIIVPAGSSHALAHALRVLADPARRIIMGACAQRTATTSFSLERMVDAYERLLRS